MRRWADLMLEHLDDLALLLTLEQGKPLAESEAEIRYAASFLEWFGEEGKRVYGDTIPSPLPDRRILVLKQPVGVAAGITPWNFPSAMPTRKAAPALAAGCTMVLKPAEQTPLSALAVAVLAEEAGLPPGVLSVVTGDAEDAPAIGGEMTSSPLVRKVGFTGSTEVGKLLMAQCAAGLKKISLELGGNAPFVVFDDADLDEAVAGTVVCKFRNSGQTCISANRILVQDGDLRRVPRAVGRGGRTRLKVGAGTEPDVKVGPLIEDGGARQGRAARRERGRRRCRAARSAASATSSGARSSSRPCSPALTAEMAMSYEETFGPVAGIARFATEEEAVRIANDTPYGLCRVLLQPRRRPRLARLGGARLRHRRHQHRLRLHRGRAVRRHEGVGHRPRGLEVRHRGLARAEVPRAGGHRLGTVPGGDCPRRAGVRCGLWGQTPCGVRP